MTNLQRVVYGIIGLVLLAVAAAWAWAIAHSRPALPASMPSVAESEPSLPPCVVIEKLDLSNHPNYPRQPGTLALLLEFNGDLRMALIVTQAEYDAAVVGQEFTR